MSAWVELRVHGVSGTPPQAMLAPRPETGRRVAAERSWARGRSAGYRWQDEDGNWIPGTRGQVLEAFHWGDHTSGSRDQALWLLLLPFGMANAAQFMLPVAANLPARALRAACGGALRLLALVMTVLFALAQAVALLDLVVWQFLGDSGWFPVELVPVMCATAAGFCAGVVILLSRLGRAGRSVTDVVRRRSPLEPGRAAVENPLDDPGQLREATALGFSSPDFFAGDPDAPTLRRLHMAAGVLVVAALAWRAVDRLSGDAGGLADAAGTWTTVALAAVAVVVLWLGDAPGADLRAPDVGQSFFHGLAAWISAVGLAAAAVSSVGAAVALLLVDRPQAPTGRALPGVDALVLVVSGTGLAALVALSVLVLLLGLFTRQPARVPEPFRRFAHGWAAALVAGLGLFLGVGFTAATTFVVQFLVNLFPGPDVRTTPLLQRVAFAWGVLSLVLVTVGLVVLLWAGRRAAAHTRVAERTFLRAGQGPLDESTARTIGRAVAQARIKSLLPIVLLVVAAAAAVLTVPLVAEQWRGLCRAARCPTADVAGPVGGLSGVAETEGLLQKGVTWFGVLVLGVLALALLHIGWRAFQGGETRRGVNVVWDVIAFWPRAAHPFVPEPYSQDVVRDLRDRICMLLEETGPDSRVVVAAHSQGTLIALAALRSLPNDACPRVGVLTFGSQLRVIFPRAFPAHVTYAAVAWLADCFEDRWVSLYRETDHVGGPVASWNRSQPDDQLESCRLGEGEGRHRDDLHNDSLRRVCGREWCLFDPPRDASTGLPVGKPRRHSDYWLDRDWPPAVARALTGAAVNLDP
jgi:hypothetical protein